MNLLKGAKDLYSENHKTLMKKIKDDTKRQKYITCSWIERINIVKMTMPPKAIYRFNAIPFFHRTRTKKMFLICMETCKRPQIAKEILR